MKKRKKTVNKLFILLIFCSGHLMAQSIKATVRDKDSGYPIPDVHIRVMNSLLATVTNGNGEFQLKGIPSHATLVLSAIGYAHTECAISDTTTHIAMEKSSVYLNNTITVTARRFEEDHFKVSEAITSVDHHEIQNMLARTAPEALMGSTGIWVQKTNHGGGSPIIRGLVGNQILLMVDGIRMNNATYRYGPNQYMSLIDADLIERIEAMRGNGSVLYGSDAMGGVVHVISKSPHFQSGGKHLHGRMSTKWTSGEMEKSLRGELQWNDEKIAALGGISIKDFGDIRAGSTFGTLRPTGYKEVAGDAKVLMRTGARGIVTTAWQHHQQHDVPRYDQVRQGGYSVYNFDPQIRQLTYLRWESNTRNAVRITTALNRSVEGIQSQKEGSVEFKDQKDIVDTYSAVADIHSAISNYWQAQSGMEWYHDRVDSKSHILNISTNEKNDVRGSYADGATSNSLAIFSTHTVDIRKISISAGARFNLVELKVKDDVFENQKLSPHAFVYTAGLAYNHHPNYTLFVSMNTGFRAPNIDDLSKFGPVESTVFEIPSSNLSPERSESVDAGIKVNTKIFSGSVTAYRTRVYDLIERMPTTFQGNDSVDNRRVYHKQNISESSLRGVEAEGEIKFSSQLSLYGNITYTYGENISKHEPMRRIPPLFGRVSIRYHHTSGLWTRMDYVTAGEQNRLAQGDLSDARISARLKNGIMPGWNIFNIYVGFSFKSLSFSLNGHNVLDKSYRVYGSGVDAYGRCVSVLMSVKF